MEELYSRDLIRRWLGIRTVAEFDKLAKRCGVAPLIMPSPTGGPDRTVFTRSGAMQIMAAWYAKKGERLIGKDPNTSEEEPEPPPQQ